MNREKIYIYFDMLSRHQLLNWMPDWMYLKIRFWIKTGYKLRLKEPVTFNEKMQWLKINYHNPEYTQMVDKYNAKKYLASVIGDEYIIPDVGGPWEKFDEIDFSKLPDRFVLKCTHDSGGTAICKDKSKFELDYVKQKFEKTLKHNYYWQGREWPYKGVKPQIIAEQLLGSEEYAPTDYKLMCFNGKVKCSFTVTNRFSDGDIFVNFYDTEWNPMPFERHYHRNPQEIEKPKTYDLMVKLAEKLAKGIPFVRVDFFEVNGKIYIGELTFFPGGGMEEFEPFEWDEKLGSWLILPEKRK